MTESETVRAKIGEARQMISEKKNPTTTDLLIDGVLLMASEMLKKHEEHISILLHLREIEHGEERR